MSDQLSDPSALRKGRWNRRLIGLGVLFVIMSGPIQFRISDFGFRIYQAAIRNSQSAVGNPDAERLLEAARAVWPKALFDGDLEQAQTQCHEALILYQQSSDQAGQARVLDELGLMALKRKQITAAKSLLEQALKAAHAASDRTREALVLEHLGRAYAAASQWHEALNADQQALALYRENQQARGESRALIHLGSIHQVSGQVGQGIQYYQQALTAARQIEDGGLVGEALDRLTWTYKSLGNIPEAWRSATQALAAHRLMGDRLGEGYTLGILGDMDREATHWEQAISSYQQALALAEQIKALALKWKLHARLARAYQEQGQADATRSAYEASIKIIEAAPAELRQDSLNQAIPIDAPEVFRDYADFLLRSSPTPAAIERALALSEQSRAYAFLNFLVRARLRPHRGVDTLMLDRERALLQKLYDLQGALQAHGVTEEERQRLLQQWTRAQEDLDGFKRDIRRVQPHYAAARYPSASTVSQIQQVLTSDAALLEYVLGRERSHLFVVTPEAFAAYPLPAAERIEQAVKEYRQLLTQWSDERDVPGRGYPLYEMLIQPAQEALRNKSQLIIVPDGWLHYLPFEALTHRGEGSEGGDRRAQGERLDWLYMVGSYTISYAPSASALGEFGRQPVDQTFGERLLMVYGDLTSAPVSAPKQGTTPSLTHDSEKEARAIEQALGKQYADVRLRKRAEDPRLSPVELNRYRLLHLAVPAVVDESEPWRSGIGLALDGDPSKESFLTIPAMFNLPLSAQLVTFSHCQPLLREQVNGEGLASLTRSLFYVGTPAVIISLWDADDSSTAEFMKAFYQRLRAGQSLQAALREAKLQLRQQAPYQHPTYWARFVLIGDGGSNIEVSSVAQGVVLLSGALMAVALMALSVFLLKTHGGSNHEPRITNH
ncbi:MAG: CHAT domain-containing protein [Acidobacteria bacterium]|nr:CHAT domain-containing protein [Acidobacteriota bacterium]